MDLTENGEDVGLRLIPRINLNPRDESDDVTIDPITKKRKKSSTRVGTMRPPQRLFNYEEVLKDDHVVNLSVIAEASRKAAIPVLQPGDQIEVFEGEQAGLHGVVEEVAQEVVTITAHGLEIDGQKMEIPARSACAGLVQLLAIPIEEMASLLQIKKQDMTLTPGTWDLGSDTTWKIRRRYSVQTGTV
jgi:transcription elongation factor SPT5